MIVRVARRAFAPVEKVPAAVVDLVGRDDVSGRAVDGIDGDPLPVAAVSGPSEERQLPVRIGMVGIGVVLANAWKA